MRSFHKILARLRSNKRTHPQVDAFAENSGESRAQDGGLRDRNVQIGEKKRTLLGGGQRIVDALF
jgi:hypothetical protein